MANDNKLWIFVICHSPRQEWILSADSTQDTTSWFPEPFRLSWIAANNFKYFPIYIRQNVVNQNLDPTFLKVGRLLRATPLIIKSLQALLLSKSEPVFKIVNFEVNNMKKSIIFITILLILFIIGCDTNNSHYKSQYKAVGLLRESTSNNYSISFKKTRRYNGA